MGRLEGLALVGVAIVTMPLLERVSDERNVRALARHVGCPRETARRLYRESRRDGYGAAYARIFPGRAIRGIPPYEERPSSESRSAAR